ncbi:SPO13 (YHR014W) [Zygosaccharomyces parabailii]|nr:SPO13 (YHR014W) [Zygosaccharomyces parabailii]CDH12613.1 uncharacterized protein ZBAI_04399 [Zygosaccharomyces bailii ISA1307]
MQRRRFRLLSERESIRPLHPRSTNVKPSAGGDIRVKQKQSLKRSSDESLMPTKRRRRERHPEPSQTCNTVFENDHVQLRLLDSDDLLPGTVSPSERLTKIEEEEDSLQLEDFDQPPESTSTPLSASRTIELSQDSFRPQLCYDANMDDSPLQDKSYEHDTYPCANYLPMGFLPQYPLHPGTHLGYVQPLGPIMSSAVAPPIRPPIGQVLNMPNVPYPTNGPAGAPIFSNQYFGAYGYGAGFPLTTSQNSESPSYKSSGGDATYQGSNESSGKR